MPTASAGTPKMAATPELSAPARRAVGSSNLQAEADSPTQLAGTPAATECPPGRRNRPHPIAPTPLERRLPEAVSQCARHTGRAMKDTEPPQQDLATALQAAHGARSAGRQPHEQTTIKFEQHTGRARQEAERPARRTRHHRTSNANSRSDRRHDQGTGQPREEGNRLTASPRRPEDPKTRRPEDPKTRADEGFPE